MKRFYKLWAIALSLLIVLSLPISAFADEDITFVDSSQDYDYSDDYYDDYYYYPDSAEDEYVISSYDVRVKVNEDNTINVSESIVADFKVEKHGIYRYIPIVNHIGRADGTTNTIYSKVKNVKSDMTIYDKYRDGDNYVIMFGDEDTVLTGKQEYNFSYTCAVGKDLVDGADEFYYNFIGNGWDTTISNVTFTIEMPKNFDSSKIGISTGSYGADGTDIVEFKVDGNTITGKLTDTLSAYEGATIRIELEDNYFTFNWLAYYGKYLVMIGVSLIALFVVIYLWVKHGRDKKIVEVVEFYPPENMNCAEISYWHNGVVSPEDTVPMLIELANEGYLKIEELEVERKGLFGKSDSFKLIYRKAYDGKDKLKRRFFNGLFDNGKRSEVLEGDLTNKFYVTVNEILRMIQESERTKVFNEKSLVFRAVGWVVSILAGAFNIVMFGETGLGSKEDFLALFIGVGISIAAFIFSFFIRQRTDKGHEIKQKIEGFKLFLETAEKERLEALVFENPTYFYDILPYAYVLGVSDVWTEKFEGIAIQPPQWYYSPYDSVWDYVMFNHFFNNVMSNASQTLISTPQGSSSGGFSGGGSFSGGGGFSGGGFGGGGGGSW